MNSTNTQAECGEELRALILSAADRHRITHNLRPLASVLAEVLEAERRAGWAEDPSTAQTKRKLLTDDEAADFVGAHGHMRPYAAGVWRACVNYHFKQ